MSTCQEHPDWMRTMWAQMTSSEFVLDNYEQFLKARPSILITDWKSLYDAIHKEGAAPASTDKRLAIELAIVKAKAVSVETYLRWIDARCQIADCLTKHASRKFAAVLQKVLNEAQWRITAEEDMLDRRRQEREVRNNSSFDEESWPMSEQAAGEMSRRQESFMECKSECAERYMCCRYAPSSSCVACVAIMHHRRCVSCCAVSLFCFIHLPCETDHAAVLCSVEWARLCLVKAACFHLMRCHRTVVD